MARKIRKAKKRERTLGQAIVWGCLVTFSVASTILLALVLIPGTAFHNISLLIFHASSATLRVDPLYQQLAESIDREEALATPFSLLCGGLTVGWLAPRYATRRRILLAGAAMAFGVVAVSLGFTWPVAVIQQNMLNQNEGGYIYPITAPLDLILRQIVWILIWIAVCVGGTWLGLRLRDRSGRKGAATPVLGPARH